MDTVNDPASMVLDFFFPDYDLGLEFSFGDVAHNETEVVDSWNL